MSDGGRFPWKMQRIVSRPTANYRNLRNPLPNPPDGMTWHHDTKTKEWSLVPVDKAFNNVEDHADLVDSLPGEARHCTQEASEAPTDDWEVLSDRVSNSSNSVLVPQSCGSVRSITSLEANESSVKGVPENSSHQTELLLPSKIQRINKSTIDSSDNALGPSGKGVLGVDYVEHVILPTDTFQGICLAYKIHGTRLRQANGFSGNSLSLAPPKLLIPLSKKALQSGFIRVQDTDAKEYKLHAFLAAMPNMSMTEAKAYLELSDWVLWNAVRSAKEDNEWEDEMDVGLLKAGEIRFSRSDGYQGAGIRSRSEETISTGTPKAFRIVPIAHEGIPEIASYSVKAQDIYHAAPQHNNFGVELQTQVNPGSALI